MMGLRDYEVYDLHTFLTAIFNQEMRGDLDLSEVIGYGQYATVQDIYRQLTVRVNGEYVGELHEEILHYVQDNGLQEKAMAQMINNEERRREHDFE